MHTIESDRSTPNKGVSRTSCRGRPILAFNQVPRALFWPTFVDAGPGGLLHPGGVPISGACATLLHRLDMPPRRHPLALTHERLRTHHPDPDPMSRLLLSPSCRCLSGRQRSRHGPNVVQWQATHAQVCDPQCP